MSRAATRNQQTLNNLSSSPYNPDYYPEQNRGKKCRKDCISTYIGDSKTLAVGARQDVLCGTTILLGAGATSTLTLPHADESEGVWFDLFVVSGVSDTAATEVITIRVDAAYDTDKLFLLMSADESTSDPAGAIAKKFNMSGVDKITITPISSGVALGSHLHFCCHRGMWYVWGITRGVLAAADD